MPVSHFWLMKVIEEPTGYTSFTSTTQAQLAMFFLAGESGPDTLEFGTIILRNQFCVTQVPEVRSILL